MRKMLSTRRLGFQLIVMISCGLAFLAIYFAVRDYNEAVSDAEEFLLDRLELIAKTAASNIDGNQHEFLMKAYAKNAILDNEDHPVYEYLHTHLYKIQQNNNLETDIYTIFYDSSQVEKGLTPFYFGVTSGETPYFKHPYNNFPPQLIDNYLVGGRVPPYKDENGHWISYFAPLKNTNDQVIGVVQVDSKFDKFIGMARLTAWKNSKFSVLVFLIIEILMILIIRKIIRVDESKNSKVRELHETVKEQHKDIKDSISYSELIQRSIVSDEKTIANQFPDSFLFYLAKDVVSGDFPWMYKKGDDIYLAAIDCTGHGVPGSMMSFVGYFLLNEIMARKKMVKPAMILEQLGKEVVKTLKQEEDGSIRDGMDIAMCKINLKKGELQFAGACRPLYFIRDGELCTFKGDLRSVGGRNLQDEAFTNHKIPIKNGDSFFIFSDGLQDQFGGDRDSKYSSKRFRNLLCENQHLPMPQLNHKIRNSFEEWKGDRFQVDDVLVMGIRV